MKKPMFVVLLLLALAGCMALPLYAGGPGLSGAIFTTTVNGQEVNFNIYASKPDVYLNGGPPVQAPPGAAGLPGPGSTVFGVNISGTYVFQVTAPPASGPKATLLSTDPVHCREFTVDSNGIIQGPGPDTAGCTGHAFAPNNNTQFPGKTVQLCALPIPGGCFLDTPNNGGEYKAWVTPIEFYGYGSTSPGCAKTTSGANCNVGAFGFIPQYSKVDNFKVKLSNVREIDTRFFDTNNNNAFIDGMGITWMDTLGASNQKVSYYNADLDVIHEAHVESPENGTHHIVIANQSGCTVDGNPVFVNGVQQPNLGPQTVSIQMKSNYKNITIFVDVYCN